MDHAPYYRAAIPDPVRILGLKLRPFSLGHLLLLHRVDSAFVTGQQPGYADLALSVFLCSQTYEDAIEALDAPELLPFMQRWQRRLCGQSGLLYRLGLRKPQPIDLAAKCEEFAQYLKDGSCHPDFTWNDENAKAVDAPLAQVIRVKLLSSTNLTDSEILNRPYGLCLWDYLTLKMFDGQIELIDGAEIEEAQRMAAEIAKKFQERN